MKKDITKEGYERAKMNLNGKSKKEAVHRLVAKAFIPNPKNKPFVNHIDCNKLNNKVENLEWCTAKENINHAIDNDKLNTIHKIKLYNDKEEFIFKSKKEASLFLGKESAYVSHMIAKGDKEIKGYKYELL